MREEAATILERPEIAILVYPLACAVLDPLVQALRMTISPIFFVDGGYELSDVSMNCPRQSCPLALGRLGPLRKQTESLQALGDRFSCRHGADLSDAMRFDDHVWVGTKRWYEVRQSTLSWWMTYILRSVDNLPLTSLRVRLIHWDIADVEFRTGEDDAKEKTKLIDLMLAGLFLFSEVLFLRRSFPVFSRLFRSFLVRHSMFARSKYLIRLARLFWSFLVFSDTIFDVYEVKVPH